MQGVSHPDGDGSFIVYRDLPQYGCVETDPEQTDLVRGQSTDAEARAPTPFRPRKLAFANDVRQNAFHDAPSFATLSAYFGDSSGPMEASDQDQGHPWAGQDAGTSRGSVSDFPASLARELDAWMPI